MAELVAKTYIKLSSNGSNGRSTKKKPKFKKTAPQPSDGGQDKKSSWEQKKSSSGNYDGSGKSDGSSKHKKWSKSNKSKSAGDKGNRSEKECQ